MQNLQKKPKIKSIFNSHNLLRKNMKYTNIEDKVKVMTMWNKGSHNKYISERLNINVRTLQWIIQKNRIPFKFIQWGRVWVAGCYNGLLRKRKDAYFP